MTVLWGDELVQIYNDAYANILGPRHPQALGGHPRTTWPEVWNVTESLYAGVRRGESYVFENQRSSVTRHGRVEDAYFTLSYSPVRDEQAAVGGILVIVTETTAQVIDARRRAVHQEFAGLLTQAVTLSDLRAGVASRRSVPDLLFAELHLREDASFPAELEGVLESFQPTPLDWRVDGTLHSAWALPLADAKSSRTMGVLIAGVPPQAGSDAAHQRFLMRLTEQVSAALSRIHDEQAIHESEARLRALARASSEVFYSMGPDWTEMRELSGGGFLADTTGPSRDWLLAYIPPEDQALTIATINEAIRTKSVFELEHRVRRVDGSIGWTWSRAVPILGQGGEIVEWFGAASDVTLRKEAEDQLRALNTTLEARVEERTRRFADLNTELRALATASLRELNEPLRRIRGFLQLLARRLDQQLDDQTKRYLELIQADVQRATGVAESFTGLAHLENRALKWSSMALMPLMVQVRSDLGPILALKAIKWTVGELPVVEGDMLLLRQAFSDLLYSALKLIPDGRDTRVEIKTETSADERWRIVIVVAPFRSGLALAREDGLALARRVIQRHGGTLEVETEAPAARFVIRLSGRQVGHDQHLPREQGGSL